MITNKKRIAERPLNLLLLIEANVSVAFWRKKVGRFQSNAFKIESQLEEEKEKKRAKKEQKVDKRY